MERVHELIMGKVYRNRNGWDYLCQKNHRSGTVTLERVRDGWTLEAHGICQYEDGTIEWDYSTGGRWTRTPFSGSEVPAGPDTAQDVLLAYVCDELCRYRIQGRSQDVMDVLCAQCALEQLVRAAGREDKESAADQTAALLQYIQEHGGPERGKTT